MSKNVQVLIFLLCLYAISIKAASKDLQKPPTIIIKKANFGLKDSIKAGIKDALKEIANGKQLANLSLKSINPLHIKKINLNYTTDQLSGTVDVENLKITGILDTQTNISSRHLEERLSLVLKHNITPISLSANYAINVKVFSFIEVKGKGRVTATLSDLRPQLKLILKYALGLNTTMLVDGLSFFLGQAKVKIQVTGLENELFSIMANKEIPKLIERILKSEMHDINFFLGSAIKDALDLVLSSYKPNIQSIIDGVLQVLDKL